MVNTYRSTSFTAWMALAFFALTSAGACAQTVTPATAPLDDAASRAWRQDLRFMADELPKRHKNLYHDMTPEQFERAVRTLDARIPTLSRNQVIVEMAKIVAMIGDGHTQMGLVWDAKIGFRQYPIRLYLYRDGLFVRAATAEYASIVGMRVVGIGSMSAESAMKRVENIAQRDNDMTVKDVLPSRLTIAEVLNALGISDDPERARFVFEDRSGKRITLDLRAVERAVPLKFVRANDGANAPLPLYLKDPPNAYWYEYLAGSRTLYVQFNSVQDKDSESIAAFFSRVLTFARDNPVDRFVIDLRLNNGGDNTLLKPIIDGLKQNDKINRKGHLYTIIGRLTFSAGQNLVNALAKNTNTLFVGEPTGGRPNHFGDAVNVVLPNSGIRLRVSTLYWQDMEPGDKRPWIAPDIPAELSSEDFRTNQDPAMKAILVTPVDAN